MSENNPVVEQGAQRPTVETTQLQAKTSHNYVRGGSGRATVDEPLVPVGRAGSAAAGTGAGSTEGAGDNIELPDGDTRVRPGEGYAVEDAMADLETAHEAIETEGRVVGDDDNGEWVKLVDEATVVGLKGTEDERKLEHLEDAEDVTEQVTRAELGNVPEKTSNILPPEVLAANAGMVGDIDDLVGIYGATRNALIPILRGLRDRHRQITDVAMQVVADRLGISAVDVEGVVSFYHFLGTAPTGQHVIHVCRTISCALRGMEQVVQRLERETGVSMGETSADGSVTLEWANCIGLCDHAPAMLVDREAIGPVTPDQAARVVGALRG